MGKREDRIKHGHNRRGKRTPEYEVWAGIRRRCNNPKDKLYSYYGGRGITYDPSWENFSVFLEDMGTRPDGFSIDRIDNSQGYCKENCRWATKKEQSQNRRNVIILTINGESKILKEWSEYFNLNYKNVYRQWRNGWDLKRIFPLG